MTTPTALESRLRTGLHAAGAALRPAPLADPHRPPGRRPARHRRHVAAAAVLVGVAVVGAVAMSGGDEPDVATTPTATDPRASGTTGTSDAASTPAADPPAGSAVVVVTDDGAELATFDADGQPGATLALDPLTRPQTAVSDRQGGWIVCGEEDVGEISPGPPESVVPVPLSEAAGPSSPTYRYRPGEPPERLGIHVLCVGNAMRVTEVGGHQVLVYQSSRALALHGLDLVTGLDQRLPIDATGRSAQSWTVGGGRLAVMGDGGLEVWDLATGARVEIGTSDLPTRPQGAAGGVGTSDLVLSPDGTTLAALVGDVAAPTDVVVVDVASGSELFRRTLPVSLEGAQVSFDGTSVAVGNYYDAYGPVRIYDLSDGTERTVEAHGLLP